MCIVQMVAPGEIQIHMDFPWCTFSCHPRELCLFQAVGENSAPLIWGGTQHFFGGDQSDVQDTFKISHYSFLSKHEIIADNVCLAVSGDRKVKNEKRRDGIHSNLDDLRKHVCNAWKYYSSRKKKLTNRRDWVLGSHQSAKDVVPEWICSWRAHGTRMWSVNVVYL